MLSLPTNALRLMGLVVLLLGVGCDCEPCVPTCVTDDDCDDGLFCNGDEICVLDPCSYCESVGNAPCTEDQVCNEVEDRCEQRCDGDDDCDDGFVCLEPECIELQLQVEGCPDGDFVGDHVEFTLVVIPEGIESIVRTVATNAEVENGNTLNPTITTKFEGWTTVTFTVTTASGLEVRSTCAFEACLPTCTADADCDDGMFCNGEEICIPDRCPTGCYPAGDPPCNDDEVCDEFRRKCERKCNNDDDCDDGIDCTVDTCADPNGDGISTCQVDDSGCPGDR